MSRAARKSEAQANAEALARRSTTYADEHARSWSVAFARSEPTSLRDLVRDLRRAYADDMPGKMHVGHVDGGGTPAYAGEFASLIYGSPRATDHGDEGASPIYQTPCRAAIDKLAGTHEAIVKAVVVAGLGPVEAAVAAGIPEDVAKLTTDGVLRRFWRMMSAGPLPMPSTMA